jgi:AcrR family transcriptional regulator
MARRVPENRFPELLDAATRVFINQGYRQTQMADVAAAAGVAKGTLYLYFESKEALFAACLRYADRERPVSSEQNLPLRPPEPRALLAELRGALAREAVPPALRDALARRRVSDVRGELEVIVRQLFERSSRWRTAIKLIDRCARDQPQLKRRIRAGKLPPLPDAAVAARFVIETIATWAVHLHWDPAPQKISRAEAEETVVHLLLGGLLGSAPRGGKG